jgi:hypothetical protein
VQIQVARFVPVYSNLGSKKWITLRRKTLEIQKHHSIPAQ